MFKSVLPSLIIGLTLSTSVSAQMNTVDINTSAINQIASEYEQAFFDRMPEMALYFGYSKAVQNRFYDHSYQAQVEWEQTEDDFYHKLIAISPTPVKGSNEYITYHLLKETLETNKASRICKESLWNVSHQWGWHNVLAGIAQKQPVGTDTARKDALARWRTVGKVIEDELNNLKQGIAEGYTAPRPVVQRVLMQLDNMVNVSVENSPFYDFAKRDNNEAFKKEIAELIKNEINPALRRYMHFLEDEYYTKARETVNVTDLPHGQACYAAMLKKHTTLNISPEEIFKLGQAHMRVLEAEVAKIGQAEYGISDMAAVFAAAKSDKRNLFKTEADILKYNDEALNRVKDIAHNWFSQMPKAQGVILPYPLHQAKTGTSGEYHPPQEDGSTPGIFYINTYEPTKISRVDHEATLFHELVPGHHFQVALAQEDKSHHDLDKYLWNSGFGEGWALYVERLADEMGLYKDNVSRLGMLSNEALRTARLIVDPGLHTLNWTREEAIAYLKSHTALDDLKIESEVDRYIIMPGQATSYMLGKSQIELLRQQSKDKLGDKFDIRDFHKEVLKNGCVTLPMLQAQIEDWWQNV